MAALSLQIQSLRGDLKEFSLLADEKRRRSLYPDCFLKSLSREKNKAVLQM